MEELLAIRDLLQPLKEAYEQLLKQHRTLLALAFDEPNTLPTECKALYIRLLHNESNTQKLLDVLNKKIEEFGISSEYGKTVLRIEKSLDNGSPTA